MPNPKDVLSHEIYPHSSRLVTRQAVHAIFSDHVQACIDCCGSVMLAMMHGYTCMAMMHGYDAWV